MLVASLVSPLLSRTTIVELSGGSALFNPPFILGVGY
jgi:hypothetical protein